MSRAAEAAERATQELLRVQERVMGGGGKGAPERSRKIGHSDPAAVAAAATSRAMRGGRKPKQRGRSGTAAGFDEGKHKRVAAGRTGGGQFAKKQEHEKVQRDLRAAGYYKGKVDGIKGPVTEEAIRKFQAAHNLPQSGQLDERTRETLRNPPSKTADEVEREQREAEAEKDGKGKGSRSKSKGSGGGDDDGKGGGRSGGRSRSSSRSGSGGDSWQGDLSTSGVLREGDGMAKGKGGEPKRKRGDGQVRLLQRKLEALGYDLGDAGVDGRFGAATKKAVQALQRDLGLKADGVVGNRTKRLLNLLGKAEQKRKAGGLGVDEMRLGITEAELVAVNAARRALSVCT